MKPGFGDTPPNNGMHPTADTAVVIRKHGGCAAGDAGRYASTCDETR
jgi:hypothetical protein